jgi:hypothetical protein
MGTNGGGEGTTLAGKQKPGAGAAEIYVFLPSRRRMMQPVAPPPTQFDYETVMGHPPVVSGLNGRVNPRDFRRFD